MKSNKYSPRSSQSAADFLKELSTDESYRTQKEEQDLKRAQEQAALRREELELVRDLVYAGIEVDSVWDLVNSAESYSAAIPILVDHLQRPYSDKILEGIVRALAVDEAKGIASQALIRKICEAHTEDLKWIVGNALTVAATPDDVDALVALARNPELGKARAMILMAIKDIQTEHARSELEELLKDEELTRYAEIVM